MKWIKIIREDGRIEYNCEHGVGHGNHIHGCDSCCSLPEFPLNCRPIPKFEKFVISINGKIFRKKDWKQMKTHIRDGYEWIQLNYKGKRIYKSIHRLLAETYLANPKKKRVINHKDGNGLNNVIDNIEWATDSENLNYCYQSGKRPFQYIIARTNALKLRKLTYNQAKLIKYRIKKGEKIKNLAKEYKVHKETISRINRGITYVYESL